MRDILIRGMEMPEGCRSCPFYAYDGDMDYYCLISSDNKPCPLVQLPPHGRLGDLDKLEDAFIRYYLSQERNNHLVFTPVEIKQHFADMIGDWPTIVPAEGGGEDG